MILNFLTKSLLALFAMCIVPSVSAAQITPSDLTVELTVYQVKNNQHGRSILVPAERIKPCDMLEYQAIYRNRSKKPVSGVRASLPIPAGNAVLAIDSPQPAKPQASLDGSRFASYPLMHWVQLADGQREQRLVPAAEYRTLRWELGNIAPGGSAKVSARVLVENGSTSVLTKQQRSE
jgi:hypothetical protein